MTLMPFGPEAVIFDDGTLARNTDVTIFFPSTVALAALYEDAAGATTLPNPITTDGEGNLFFYAEQGEYDIVYQSARVRIATDVPGPQGLKGDKGDPGPTGPAGGAASTYVHDQAMPSDHWSITHNLGYYPNVTIVDSGGTRVMSDVQYPDVNTIVIDFVAAFGGKAYLS